MSVCPSYWPKPREHWSCVCVWCLMFPPRLLRSWNTRWKTPSNSQWNWMLKWKLAPAGETCRTWSCDNAVWLCHVWGGRRHHGQGCDHLLAVWSSCAVFLLAGYQTASWNMWWKLLWSHQSSVRGLKRVFRTVKLLIVKRRIFKWILLKCAWSCTTPQSPMNLLHMKWAGLCY